MKRNVTCLAIIITASLFLSSMTAAQEKPDATLTLEQDQVGIGFGFSFGEGVLTYQGKDYHFSIDGWFSVFDVGVTRGTAKGSVYGLKKLEDFNGNYIAATAEGTLGRGTGATTMKNHNGVLINLVTTTQGFNVKLAPSGFSLKLM